VGAAGLAVQQATETGASLGFGCLAGGPAPFDRAATRHDFIIAFRLLTVILFPRYSTFSSRRSFGPSPMSCGAAAGYLLAASLMNIPGALMLAHHAVPDGFMGFDLGFRFGR
jgi:hypothetical protein